MGDALVAIGRDRDEAAFALIYDYYAGRIKSFLMGKGMNEDTAEELTQEIMLTVWRRAESYDPNKAAASTWLFTIARNRRIDYLRGNSRIEVELDDEVLDLERTESDVQARHVHAEQSAERLGAGARHAAPRAAPGDAPVLLPRHEPRRDRRVAGPADRHGQVPHPPGDAVRKVDTCRARATPSTATTTSSPTDTMRPMAITHHVSGDHAAAVRRRGPVARRWRRSIACHLTACAACRSRTRRSTTRWAARCCAPGKPRGRCARAPPQTPGPLRGARAGRRRTRPALPTTVRPTIRLERRAAGPLGRLLPRPLDELDWHLTAPGPAAVQPLRTGRAPDGAFKLLHCGPGVCRSAPTPTASAS